MRITQIVETSVPLRGEIANALVDFSRHTVSLVAVVSDQIRDGRPVTGVAFNSIGRFAQGGILADRMIPRVLGAPPESLLDGAGRIDPARVLARALTDEKPGGHGDRAGAAAALELACWDLNAKLADEPAYRTIARAFGRDVSAAAVPVYAAGGYYYPGDGLERLRTEMRGYLDQGYDAVKMKIGGAAMRDDLDRVEAVIDVVGGGSRVAVDANGRFDAASAGEWAKALSPYGLRWFEEPGDPLDFELNARVTAGYRGAVATGENLFSVRDVTNLVRYGGMRPSRDIFQMDAGLSYGLTEYARMLEVLEQNGFDRRFAFPHGGHLINLHIAVGLGLGGCESYPGVFAPFGGYSPACVLSEGTIAPTDAPGFGLEEKPDLAAVIAEVNR
ncbi:enolase C-terminal domain-like protein [[Mycobacterium] crassicus]|uniref:Enolase C-terminal domain-like protein n=1 Tax=[Mycobacterium] crassicus TaxID=2872309 RepID=A0ABU5XRK9_9MYCO|nr:enolase C-terminal domain-like protein [Mycolicibacter sp. MYC098]MEB3023942.1 enolase C-terminal domain-like protein [Mycolicibacter sp. MYC098]